MSATGTETPAIPTNHQAAAEHFRAPEPIGPAENLNVRRSPAEEAKTIVSGQSLATLATLSEGDHPWASLVAYGLLEDGTPVLMLSTLAEHGRNVLRDTRVSLSIGDEVPSWADPLDTGRVTITGRVEEPADDAERDAAWEAYAKVAPASVMYRTFGDFTTYLLRIDRIRWVGGYGRMDWADVEGYVDAEPDPVAPNAAHAIEHLNEDHADVLLLIAQNIGGYTDATTATCLRADRYGIDLKVDTPRGKVQSLRIGFPERVNEPDGLRAASIELAKLANADVGKH